MNPSSLTSSQIQPRTGPPADLSAHLLPACMEAIMADIDAA